MPGLLGHLRANGFTPSAIVDVGAFVGDWARMASSVFPEAELVMIEGNPENEGTLRGVQRALGPRARYYISLLGAENREDVLFYQQGSGSSAREELTSFEKRTINLRMRRLDTLLSDRQPRSPALLKLDVQGAELDVLRGGMEVLRSAEVVILEVALLPYNRGAPLCAEVVGFMDGAGYSVFDFCGQFRRESDNALFQTDIVFVRKQSHLRAPRKFWLREP